MFLHGSLAEDLRSQGSYIYGSRLSRLTVSMDGLERYDKERNWGYFR